MKALLLVLLISSPLMTPATPVPRTISDGTFPLCAYGQVYRATYFRSSPSGPECGLTYMYCFNDVPSYHEGCTTSYRSVWYAQCLCE
jgi:hypothetical protein